MKRIKEISSDEETRKSSKRPRRVSTEEIQLLPPEQSSGALCAQTHAPVYIEKDDFSVISKVSRKLDHPLTEAGLGRGGSRLITPPCSMLDLQADVDDNNELQIILPAKTEISRQADTPESMTARTLSSEQGLKADETPARSARSALLFSIFILFVTAASILSFTASWERSEFTVSSSSVYVEGGGFSGFWYTLGRLASVQDPHEREFYCYSAGCLGVISIFANLTKDEMLEHAVLLQNQWKNGEISRYEVAPNFIDRVVPDQFHFDRNPDIFSNVHIITSQKHESGFGLQASIQTPHSADHLRTLLKQTTWIPGATGHDLWYEDHMDGAFTQAFHPKCGIQLSAIDSLELMVHALNVNLNARKARYFWKSGYDRGI